MRLVSPKYLCFLLFHLCSVAQVMSGPLGPSGLISLLCPWDFPSKNTAGVVMPSSRGLPDLGLKSAFPALQAVSLPAGPLGKPCCIFGAKVIAVFALLFDIVMHS